MSEETWKSAEQEAGVALTLAASKDVGGARGHVTTFAARNLMQRGASQPDALRRVTQALARVYQVDAGHVHSENAIVSVNLAAADSWLCRVGPNLHVLGVHAASVHGTQPQVRVEGAQYSWPDFVDIVGRDAATWAVLLSASGREPIVVGPSLAVLSSRLDTHPLALARRAHAALTLRLTQQEGTSADLAPRPPISPAVDDLLTAIALLERAAMDSTRTHRSRPVSQAVSSLAHAALRYLEVTPVTRTDLLLSEVARTVLADALVAADLAAPVPY